MFRRQVEEVIVGNLIGQTAIARRWLKHNRFLFQANEHAPQDADGHQAAREQNQDEGGASPAHAQCLPQQVQGDGKQGQQR